MRDQNPFINQLNLNVMKKLIFIATITMLATACGPRQPAEEAEHLPEPAVLQAGNLLGHHTLHYELAPGVTTDELLDFTKDKFHPAYEKHHPGLKLFPLSGRTGECVDCWSTLYVFESTGVRDKYFTADGSRTELSMAALEKMQPEMEELLQMVEYTTTYTDWEIIGDTGTPGPELQAGNLLGLHTMHYELAPGVTIDESIDFMKDEHGPAFEKHFPGGRFFILKGRTGEGADCYGWLFVFESVEVRDKYFKADGSYTELGQANLEKMQPVIERGSKFGEYTTTYTDWVIQ